MKKVIATGAVLLLAGSIQPAYAGNQEEGYPTQQVTHRNWAISGYIGIADFDGDEKPDPFRPEVTHEVDSDKAFKGGVILSKYYNDFSFNLGIEYIQEVSVEDEAGSELAEHSHIPVSLGVNYHFNTRIVKPYIGAGIGYSFNDTSESDFIAAQGIQIEVDDSVFYYLTAGVEYPLNDQVALFLAGQYTIGDADMKGSAQTPTGIFEIEDEEPLDRYECNVGVKYFF